MNDFADGARRVEEFSSPQGFDCRYSKYEIEKLHGIRRSTGALKLKRLKPRHYRALFLHMNGARNQEIARMMGWSEVHVSIVLNDPLSQAFISQGMTDIDQEFRALLGPTVDVLKETLAHADPDIRLKAAEKVLRVNGKFEKKADSGAVSAESLIRSLLEQAPRNVIQKQVNIQINSGKPVDPYITEQLGELGKCQTEISDSDATALSKSPPPEPQQLELLEP